MLRWFESTMLLDELFLGGQFCQPKAVAVQESVALYASVIPDLAMTLIETSYACCQKMVSVV